MTIAGGALEKLVLPLAVTLDVEANPGIGWDGTQFTVPYNSGNRGRGNARYLQHVSAAGATVGAPAGPLTDKSGEEVVLVWNGESFLEAWIEETGRYMRVRRLSAAGAELETGAGHAADGADPDQGLEPAGRRDR